ncbi:MAG: RNA polymerase sigma-70 factor [Gemmatimonadaceae bacterium]
MEARTAPRHTSETTLEPKSDNLKLLDQLRSGDEAAFDVIFRAWYPSLVRASESIVRSRAIAEEVVQDVMLAFWQRRDSLAADGSPQAYLFQSVRNRSLNHARHERVAREGEPFAIGSDAVESRAHSKMVEDEMRAAVEAAVEGLPGRCREVFELSRVHGLKYSEIATKLGISVKTVEAQMGKALKVLRTELSPWLT